MPTILRSPSACSWHLPSRRAHHVASSYRLSPFSRWSCSVNAGLGAYHAGVEWGFWLGPTECSGTVLDLGKGGLLEISIG